MKAVGWCPSNYWMTGNARFATVLGEVVATVIVIQKLLPNPTPHADALTVNHP